MPGIATVAKLADALSMHPGRLLDEIGVRGGGVKPGQVGAPPEGWPTAPDGGVSTRSAHNLELVEVAVLTIVTDLHPKPLTEDDLISTIAANSEDQVEIKTIKDAIRELGYAGLVRNPGQSVAPTQAALRASALLTR